ncbi:uncharacterized protein FTOL_05023 [Fusarium torulosum]|uniref:Uncharacterized protein n=1 Tax=Fusarium torulosum TaxID=33205 RepID=A0AAE8M6U8_9HYPO|nr:uncharacterized protein FTOL_05023 [Fusarium torulosum]
MAIDAVTAQLEIASVYEGHDHTAGTRNEVDDILRQWTVTATVGTGDALKDLPLRDEVLLDDSTRSPESLNDFIA